MTRGPHGVLELTVPKLVVERRGRFLPHLEEMTPNTSRLLEASLALKHGRGWERRFGALRKLLSAVKELRR